MRAVIAAVVGLLLSTAPAAAQLENVGSLSFPTSGSPEAQKHFLRGVAILHSFGWKQAIEQFQAAQKLQPDFALAYWGETLCYNHPLNPEQDAKNPRAVLARLGPDRASRLAKAPTAREKGFLEAVEDLWADGPDWRARRVAYMQAMARLYKQVPDDDEVKAFYALSLMSAGGASNDMSFRPQMKAGALALDIVQRNPNHPGATHYIIHAFDDPVHAPLGLDAARAYARIVPAVSHAVHMPTHIFIQHGMWNEVANQNVRAFDVARALYQAGDAPNDMAHSTDWGHYGFLQLGDYASARERIRAIEAVDGAMKFPRASNMVALANARYILETEEWKVQPVNESASVETILANGISAVKTGDLATADRMSAMLVAKAPAATGGGAHADHGAVMPAPAGGDEAAKANRVASLELQALILEAKGPGEPAIKMLEQAVAIEESMRAPYGAADPIEPSHELLGEVLLRAGKAKDAAAAYEASLLRMPNRARALMGAAKAYAAAGNAALAAERYATLMSFWKGKAPAAPTTSVAAQR